MIKRGDGEWISGEFKLGSQELIPCYAVLVAAWWEGGQFYTDEAVEVGRVEYRYDAGSGIGRPHRARWAIILQGFRTRGWKARGPSCAPCR